MQSIGIGALAKQAGVGIDTVRGARTTLIAACPGHGRTADCQILKAHGEDDA